MQFKLRGISRAVALAVGGVAVQSALLGAAVAQQQLERVEITGSSIKRIDAETALPVQVITREEITRLGVTSTEDLLKTVSATSGLGSTVLATGAGTTTYGNSNVSLRGLTANRTLVLVNGRRLATFAGDTGQATVNVNSIPLSAIERVDVLKDGASAVYGSDAVAGVVNFILRKDFSGIEVGFNASKPTRTGGGTGDGFFLVGGIGDRSTQRFNVTASLTYDKQRALFAKDRDFAATGNKDPYYAAGATGQGNIEGAYNPTNSAADGRVQPFGNSPGTGYGNPLAATGQCASINMFSAGTTTKGGPYCAFDSNAFVGLIPESERTGLSLNGAFKITEAIELFGDVLYSRNKNTQIIQPSPARRSFFVTDDLFAQQGVDPVLLLRPNNPNYQLAANYLNSQGFGSLVGKPLAITSRVFDFGLRTTKDTSTQTRGVLGARGSVLGQDYEVAYSDNQSKVSGTVPDGFFSQVAYARVINDPNSDWNPWSLTQSAAFNSALAAANAKYTGATLEGKSKNRSVDGKVSGEIVSLPAGPLQYALGFQFRKESLKQDPSAALGTGDIAGLGGAVPPVDKDRRVSAPFGELVVPIIKGLEGNLSARTDRYSDSGTKSTYKTSLRWQALESVLLRASYGTGFRAPTLVDLYSPQVVGTSEQFTDPATGQTNLQVNSVTGGNEKLLPEKSKQYSVGVVLQPTNALSLSADWFRIRVTDIINTPSAQEVVSRFRAGDPAYAGLVVLSPSGDVDQITQISINSGSAIVSGVDVSGGFKTPLGPGRFSADLNGTYMSKFDETSAGGFLSHKAGTLVEPDGTPVIGAQNGGVVLRWKHILSFNYGIGDWTGTFAQNFYTGYRTGDNLNGEPNNVGDQALYDLRLAWSGIKGLNIALGVKNLFNKNPPVAYIPVSNQFQAGYDVNLYDPLARVIYIRAAYKFL